ncbi:hypothetical protein [Nonomuraea sp. NPDC003201]
MLFENVLACEGSDVPLERDAMPLALFRNETRAWVSREDGLL